MSWRSGDHEWPMLSYYVIYYEKFKKSYAANREGSLNVQLEISMCKDTIIEKMCKGPYIPP